MDDIQSLSVTELADLLTQPNPPLILDVREDAEVAQSSLPNTLHIPLGQLPNRLAELEATDPDRLIAVICKAGGRSARATAFLMEQGFNAANITGGMLAYRAEVDPALPPVL